MFGVIENVVLVEPEAIVTDPDSETISSAVADVAAPPRSLPTTL